VAGAPFDGGWSLDRSGAGDPGLMLCLAAPRRPGEGG
jgi:hypothetical protein